MSLNFDQEIYSGHEYTLTNDDEFWNDSWSKMTHGPDDLLSKPMREKTVTVVHDHPYCVKNDKHERSESLLDLLQSKPLYVKKNPTYYDKPSQILENMVSRALADLKDDEAVKQKRALPDSILNSELYKLLCKDEAPKGQRNHHEAFGHYPKTSFRKGVDEESIQPGHLLRSKKMKNTTLVRFTCSGEVTYSSPSNSTKHDYLAASLPPSAQMNKRPEFVNIPEKFWTLEQCQAYDRWWQNLPACPFSKPT